MFAVLPKETLVDALQFLSRYHLDAVSLSSTHWRSLTAMFTKPPLVVLDTVCLANRSIVLTAGAQRKVFEWKQLRAKKEKAKLTTLLNHMVCKIFTLQGEKGQD